MKTKNAIVRKAVKPAIVTVAEIAKLDAVLNPAPIVDETPIEFGKINQAVSFLAFVASITGKKIRKSSIVKVMLSSAESATGKIELALLSAAGISTEEMKAFRGAVAGLVPWYRKAGFIVEKRDNRFYCTGRV